MLLNKAKWMVHNNYYRMLQNIYRYGSGSSDSDEANKSDSGSDQQGEPVNKPCDVCSSDPCECNPSAPTMYDQRKYGHNIPRDSASPHFDTLPCLPTGIFRCTAGEALGRGAKKGSWYQNPEYFSYHHMTFYDMHMLLRSYRSRPSPDTGRKP